MVATWYVNGDEGPIGGSGGSKFTNGGKFEIRNLQRSDFSDEAKAMQCLTLSETFRLDMTGPGQTAATPRLMYKPDFEDCMGVTFDLVATHPDGIAELKCHFDVRVSDRNDRPFWKEDVLPGANKYGDITDGSSNLAKLKKVRTIEERSARSAAITGPLEATDSDVGQEFVYKITAGNDDNFFRVNSCSGQLYVNKEGLDYNTKNAYQLTVDVTDDSEFFEDANFPNGLSTASTLVDILIEDKNDVPVICYDKAKYPVECGTNEAKEFSVYEDALPTDAIGTVLAADFDTNDVLQYTLDPAFDASLFVIGLTDGVIKLKTGTALDYETRQLYKVTVIVRDYYTKGGTVPLEFRGGEARHTFPISILDANDSPVFPSINLELDENSQAGATTVTDFAALDVDNGGKALTYNLLTMADADNANVVITDLFELKTVGTGTSALQYVAVKTLGARTFNFETPEDCCVAAGCGTADTACDAVINNGNAATCTGVTATAGNACVYQPSAGTRFMLTVSATDSGIADTGGVCGTHCAAKTGTGTIFVTIRDVNEPPLLETLTVNMQENMPLGDLVKKLTFTDPDAHDQASGKVQMFVHKTRRIGADGGCNPGGIFATKWLSITAGGQLQSRQAIDFETSGNPGTLSSFCVEIKVADSLGLTNAVSTNKYQSVTVTVDDVNEPPLLAAAQVFTVAESLASGAVGTIVVADPDAADAVAGSIKIVVTGGDTYGSQKQFDVAATGSSVTGFAITVASGAALNYELQSRYELRVNVTDSNDNTVEGMVVVSLTDVDEKPVIKNIVDGVQVPIVFKVSEHNTGQSTADCTQAKFCLPGTIVGEIRGFDEDIVDGVPEVLSFEITSGNTDGTFELVKSTDDSATLKVKKITSRLNSQQTIKLMVRAVGAKNGLAGDPSEVTVEVVEVNFVPVFKANPVFTPVTEDAMKAAMDSGATLSFGEFECKDLDANYPLTLTIKATDPPGFTQSFDIVPSVTGRANVDFTLNLANQVELDFEEIQGKRAGMVPGEICLTIDADDSAGATAVDDSFCIKVGDSNEPPVLAPASFEVNENEAKALVGTLYARDVDAADQPTATTALTYSIDPAVDGFSLTQKECNTDKNEGQRCAELSLTKALDFEALATTYGAAWDAREARLSVNVKVTDSKPFVTTALVFVSVVDANEPPVITGGAQTMNIKESAVPGTKLGTKIATTDPDSVQKNLKYSLEGADAAFFAVSQTRDAGGNSFAELSLNATGGSIDFEDRTVFNAVLRVDDGGNANNFQPAKSATAALKLVVENVNDVTITKVEMVSGAGHSASGGDTVRITGTNFGPTTKKAGAPENAPAPTLLVTYGGDQGATGCCKDFTATGCTVTAKNTVIECKVAVFDKQVRAAGLNWIVSVDGDKSAPSADTTHYMAPTVTGAVAVVAGGGQLATSGTAGDKVLISGTNFGKEGMTPFIVTALGSMSYSYNFLSAASLKGTGCVLKPPVGGADQLECTTGEGTGSTLEFQVMVGGQSSATFKSTVGYANPSITAVAGGSGIDINNLLTTGRESIVVTGTNFGPIGTVVGATYGSYASTCTVSKAHVEMVCQTVAGSGKGLQWRVHVITGGNDKQMSPLNGCPTCVTSYHPPIITSVGGANIKDLRTEGGQEIQIFGQHFGAPMDDEDCSGGIPRPTIAYGNPAGGASFALFNTTTELSGSCCKVLSPTLVSCLSGAGVGRGHSFQITVSDQTSNIFASTSGMDKPSDMGYGPPVLVLYDGKGSKNANTEGNEDVIIEGRNFGPSGLGSQTGTRGAITSVTYGLAIESVESATGKKGGKYKVPLSSCEITTDHFFITCKNLPGAGKGMAWLIVVDGQESITPSTYYARPVVTEIRGPSSGELNTNGQEVITLVGTNFGPDPLTSVTKTSPITGKNFLQSVTYGPNGNHYAAMECKITVSSTEITCKTAPGVGATLKWIVTVEGQTSTPFTWGGYELPKINSMVPQTGPTKGKVQVMLSGRGFGLRDPTSTLVVTFGGVVVEVYGSGANDDPTAGDTSYFSLPESYGKNLRVFITVTTPSGVSLRSNDVPFSYNPPKIDLLTSDWADAAAGLLRLTAIGSNFCSGNAAGLDSKNGCGSVFIDGKRQDPTSWSHTEVVMETSLDEGNVMIKVGTGTQMQASGSWPFAHLSPAIDKTTIESLANLKYATPGGQDIVIKGYFFGDEISVLRVTIGGDGGGRGPDAKEATITNYNSGIKISDGDLLTIKLPEGQGKDLPLIVWRGKQPSPAAYLSYEPPTIDGIADPSGAAIAPGAAVSPTTGGGKIIVTGKNFGTGGAFPIRLGDILVSTEVCNLPYPQCHSKRVFDMPPGVGGNLAVIVMAGNQDSNQTDTVNPTVSYNPPTIGGFSLPGAAGRRRRGLRTLLAASPSPSSSSSLSPSPSSSTAAVVPAPSPGAAAPAGPAKVVCPVPKATDSNVPSGGKTLPPGPTTGGQCITITGADLGNINPVITFGNRLAEVQARDTLFHKWIVLVLPEGEGANLDMTVRVGNQMVKDKYSYLKPVITSLTPKQGPTSGIDAATGQPILMTITGSNFGRPEASGVREVRITPPSNSATPYVIKVSTFVEETHTKLAFYMPEGYGQKDTVEVNVVNQAWGNAALTFDYTRPTIKSVMPYCPWMPENKCRAPQDQFDTDGCSDIVLWEDYTDWQGRRNSALQTVLNSDFDRKCGYANDRWQLALIEGTSLGSYAMAQAGAPLRVAVSRPDQVEDFLLSTAKVASCPECLHTHTRIVARTAWGYGRDLNLTVAFGASKSNPYTWSYKAPEIRSIHSSGSNVINADGAGEIILRGRNFGRTADPTKMVVRVFIGYDYNVKGEAIGYQGGDGLLIDLAAIVGVGGDSKRELFKSMQGKGMKECHTLYTDETTKIESKLAARWHPSYNYSIPGARNVDGFPYIACSPQKDVSGPKNVTIVLGSQIDSCATNYRLCADPISWSDRRMRKPSEYCARQELLEAQGGSSSNDTNATKASECRDDSFCTWDCFSNSLFVGQCVSNDKSNTASYAKSGQLCAPVSEAQAKCEDKSCMSLDAQAGFFRLTVDINCTKPSPDEPCDISEAGVVAWNRPAEAARAMGTNTELKLPRCPVERWEPLVPINQQVTVPPVDYSQYQGIQLPTECFDIVSCHPKFACNGSNVCNENGYHYTKRTCEYIMNDIPNASLACTTSDECRSMDKKGNFGGFPLPTGQAPYNEPQAQSRCIKKKDPDTGKIAGRCECYTSPRCSLCTVGSNWLGLDGDHEYFTAGFFRMNGKCAKCPENPGLLVGVFLGGMVLLCIGVWFLQKKNFNVAFISIGWDYFQVLALFARAEIEWPPLMRAMFDFFSAFNFNIDITAPECLIPNMDYKVKWWFIQMLPVAAISFLCFMFFSKMCFTKMQGKEFNCGRKFGKIIAQYLLMLYYVYLSVTRRALDVFNCNPSVPSDGYFYTEFTSIDCEGGLCKCGIEGSTQVELVPWALLFLGLYTLGFPGFVLTVILKNKDLIKEDQMLRAYDLAPTRKTAPKAYEIRKKYHFMYVLASNTLLPEIGPLRL
jgi:hypothetical protein